MSNHKKEAFSNFPWPSLDESGESPVWTGKGFLYKEKLCTVLCYSQNMSNWNTDLTHLHEVEAGLNHPIDVASRKLAIKTIARYCAESNAIVLEVGSSSGYLLSEMQRALPNINLIGSDFIKEPLSYLSKTFNSIPFIQYDLRECPLPSQSIDAVVILNVLEHIDNDEVALSQIYRILKDGGIAHIEVPSSPRCFDIYDEYLMHFRRYRMYDLIALAKKTGFEIVKATHLACLAYPAFYIVKRYNQRFMSLPAEKKKGMVVSSIRKTKTSKLFEVLIKAEMMLEPFIKFPFGIRCVLILKKRRKY